MYRKFTLFISACLVIGNIVAQKDSIYNSSLERWLESPGGEYENPVDWNTLNEYILEFGFGLIPPNVNKTDGQIGNYAAQLTSIDIPSFPGLPSGTLPGAISNGWVDEEQVLATFEPVFLGGTPIEGRPDSLITYVSYITQGTDTAVIGVRLTKWDSVNQEAITVGEKIHLQLSDIDDFSRLALPIEYDTLIEPDTILLWYMSSYSLGGSPNSKLIVDYMELAYPTGLYATQLSGGKYELKRISGQNAYRFKMFKHFRGNYRLYNIQGKLLQKNSFRKAVWDVHLNGFNSGIYLIELQDEKGIVIATEKLLR